MKESKKVIYLYTAFQFFYTLLVWVPVFYEYQKLSGVSDFQIFHIQSLYYIVFCFLEIPTGYLADRLGYKKCLIWGAGTLIFANLLPIFAAYYSGFLWHFLLIALSRSFISGASSAYLYEYLQQNQVQHEYAKVEGKARAISLFGKVFCWAIVGFLMKWHLTLPYWITTFNALISLFFVLKLPEISFQKSTHKSSFHGTLKALKYLGSNFYLLFIIIQGIGIFTLTRLCQVNLYQPILNSKNFTLYSFGWIMSLMTLSEALGSFFPQIFQSFKKNRQAVSFATIAMGLTLFLIPYADKIFTLILLLIFSLASGIAFPIQKQLINDAIQEKTQFRATLLSLESIVDRAVCAWMAALIGSSLQEGKLNDLLTQSGIFSSLGILILSLVFMMRRSHQKSKSLDLSTSLEEGAFS